MQTIGRRLLWHGMVLFLSGLLTGLAEQNFSNTRVGLALAADHNSMRYYIFTLDDWGRTLNAQRSTVITPKRLYS